MFLLLGVQYAQAERNRQLFRHGQLTIPFIGVADFIKNKEASGRKKDLQDIRRLVFGPIVDNQKFKAGKALI